MIEECGQTEKIKLIGEVKNIEKFLSIIDVFVSHSLWEGLPLSVLEAISRSTGRFK